ncbi:DUF4129 domain-containing transglutaminase family protein [Effusibacillus pohliae]|uniref:DUF4129 domain-containing transglutaminase family protein n=1 Tax=Effusibacillus pohliae TaxID=232270 RepID=UPI000380B68E|nr:transglutaminase domain-containing protein [Effusibacillus pohliae]
MRHTTRWITGTWTRDWLLTTALFVWLYQLLSPLGKAGGVPDMFGFYLFVGLCLLFDLLLPWRSARIGLKLAAVFAFMHHFYYTGSPVWRPNWLLDVLRTAADGAWLALQQKLAQVPENSQTLYFLLFLWLTASVYRNALQSRGWLFVLLFIGEVVIGVIDTFFPPDASGFVVRYFLIGFLLLSLSQLPELEKWLRVSERMRGWPLKWIAWTLAVTLAAVGSGMAAPKYPPAWPDPVSFLESKTSRENHSGPKKIGYGADDNHLGGPYVMDDTVAFTVITNQSGYYRGESKLIYTGKGWLNGSGGGFSLDDFDFARAANRFRNGYALNEHIKTKTVEQEIRVENGQYSTLFGQYQAMQVQAMPDAGSGPEFASFFPIDWRLSGNLRAGQTYKVVSQVPYYDLDGVRQRERTAGPLPNLPELLQLPPNLPPRVHNLALQITAGKAGDYEKAKAIEQYLRTNYMYETQDIPFPADDQDFVDQFLFESRKGYCDHFSSAMVVLARAAGLPARWVKGFTEGEQDPMFSATDGRKKYVVRNRNAHSWAEVYIPGTGWLPFEPTAGFSQPVVMQDLPVAVPNTQAATPQQPERTQRPEVQDTSVDVSHEIDWQTVGTVTLWIAVVLLAIGFLFRRRLLAAFYVRHFARKEADENSQIVVAIERLLRVLQRFGWKREPDVTVREFGAELADSGYKGSEWVMLARIFERVRYGNKRLPKKEIGELRELWGRIVRKIGRTKKR